MKKSYITPTATCYSLDVEQSILLDLSKHQAGEGVNDNNKGDFDINTKKRDNYSFNSPLWSDMK